MLFLCHDLHLPPSPFLLYIPLPLAQVPYAVPLIVSSAMSSIMEQDYMAANDENEPETTLQLSPPPAKRLRPEPSAGRLKGDVPQQNGNWGAQIYAHHQRIWLGTFKSERSAAIVYDRAAVKLQTSCSIFNFSFLSPFEPLFQNLQSEESILTMIRDGSHGPKLSDFSPSVGAAPSFGPAFKELFQKELTPSDVSKLNRLVIPKKHALNFFPCKAAMANSVMLEFRDFEDRRWEFRFCFWKCSKSFVFSRGWRNFVVINQLQSKDVVTFYGGEERDGFPSFYLIDVSRPHCAGETIFRSSLVGNGGGAAGRGAQEMGRRGCDAESEAVTMEEKPEKPFQLFGVQICDA